MLWLPSVLVAADSPGVVATVVGVSVAERAPVLESSAVTVSEPEPPVLKTPTSDSSDVLEGFASALVVKCVAASVVAPPCVAGTLVGGAPDEAPAVKLSIVDDSVLASPVALPVLEDFTFELSVWWVASEVALPVDSLSVVPLPALVEPVVGDPVDAFSVELSAKLPVVVAVALKLSVLSTVPVAPLPDVEVIVESVVSNELSVVALSVLAGPVAKVSVKLAEIMVSEVELPVELSIAEDTLVELSVACAVPAIVPSDVEVPMPEIPVELFGTALLSVVVALMVELSVTKLPVLELVAELSVAEWSALEVVALSTVPKVAPGIEPPRADEVPVEVSTCELPRDDVPELELPGVALTPRDDSCAELSVVELPGADERELEMSIDETPDDDAVADVVVAEVPVITLGSVSDEEPVLEGSEPELPEWVLAPEVVLGQDEVLVVGLSVEEPVVEPLAVEDAWCELSVAGSSVDELPIVGPFLGKGVASVLVAITLSELEVPGGRLPVDAPVWEFPFSMVLVSELAVLILPVEILTVELSVDGVPAMEDPAGTLAVEVSEMTLPPVEVLVSDGLVSDWPAIEFSAVEGPVMGVPVVKGPFTKPALLGNPV